MNNGFPLSGGAVSDGDAPSAAGGRSETPSPGGGAAAADPSAITVVVDPNLAFRSNPRGGQSGTDYVVVQHATGKHFEIGETEHRLIRRMIREGTGPVIDNPDQLPTGYDADRLGELLKMLVGAGLAWTVVDGPPAPPPPAPASAGLPAWAAAAGRLLNQRIVLAQGRAAERWIPPWSRGLFTPAGTAVWLLLVAAAGTTAIARSDDLAADLSVLWSTPPWWSLMAIWMAAKLVHEFGHAAAAVAMSVPIRSVGLLLFMAAPMPSVDVTDAWGLRSRLRRNVISLAGVYLELATAAAALLGWAILNDRGGGNQLGWWLLQWAMIAGPATLLVNANPLLRLDGYHVLADCLNIPNLRRHGRAWWAERLRRRIVGKSADSSPLSGWRRWAAAGHAAASVAFQIVWMGGLVVTAATWHRGLGMVLAIAGIFCWALVPLVMWTAKMWGETGPGLTSGRRRLITLHASWMAVVLPLLLLPSPMGRGIPLVVRYAEPQHVHAPVDARVRRLFVDDGDVVHAGDRLVQMVAPEASVRSASHRTDAATSRIRSVAARAAGDWTAARSADETARHHDRQHRSLLGRLDRLEIRANRRGVVIGRQLTRTIDRHFPAGERIFTVASPDAKEVVISLDAPDLADYRAAQRSQRPVVLRFRGGGEIVTVLEPAGPKATRRPPHPALIATGGGPLPVRPDGDRGPQLIRPRHTAVLRLPPEQSLAVRSGQIGTLRIGDTRPVYIRLWRWFEGENLPND